MKRRELLGLLGGAVVAWPLAVCAQEQGRTYRLGSLHFSPRSAPHHVALFAELKRQGFIAGQNLWVDERGYGLHPISLPSMPYLAFRFISSGGHGWRHWYRVGD